MLLDKVLNKPAKTLFQCNQLKRKFLRRVTLNESSSVINAARNTSAYFSTATAQFHIVCMFLIFCTALYLTLRWNLFRNFYGFLVIFESRLYAFFVFKIVQLLFN